MISELTWKRYVQCMMASSRLAEEAMRVNDTTINPQLLQLANKTLLALLKQKGHVPTSYKLDQCLEVAKKGGKKLSSTSTTSAGKGKQHKYDVQTVAYTRKDAVTLHRDFVKACNVPPIFAATKQIAMEKLEKFQQQLLSRTSIKNTSSYV